MGKFPKEVGVVTSTFKLSHEIFSQIVLFFLSFSFDCGTNIQQQYRGAICTVNIFCFQKTICHRCWKLAGGQKGHCGRFCKNNSKQIAKSQTDPEDPSLRVKQEKVL